MAYWAKVALGIRLEYRYGIVTKDTRLPFCQLVMACCEARGLSHKGNVLSARRALGHRPSEKDQAHLVSVMFYGRAPKDERILPR